jgi:CheY-like chemotaxis protein
VGDNIVGASLNFETRLLNCTDLQSVLDCVLDNGLELTEATLGNVKLVNQQGYLTIAAQRGFHQEFLDFFHRANADDCLTICGRALRDRRAIISDVMSDEEFAPWRSVAERAGFRSLQSTPIISGSGALLGIVSTHFPIPHQPTESEMNAVRLLANLAASAIVRDGEVEDSDARLISVVVIDDDKSVRSAMENLIRSLGYSVAAFDSARTFLESDAIQSTSCLITDIHMPEMSGIELQRHLSAAGHQTPIIFITGRPDDATRARVIGDGAVGYLSKPLHARNLLALLNQALNRDH